MFVSPKGEQGGGLPNAGLIYIWPTPIKFFKAYACKVVDKPIVWVTPEAIEGGKLVRLNTQVPTTMPPARLAS